MMTVPDGNSKLRRVINVLEEYSEIAGGVPAVAHQLSHRLAARGNPVGLLYADGEGMATTSNDIEMIPVPSRGFAARWRWSPQLRPSLVRLASRPEPPVFHIHGVWSAPQLLAARVARLHSIPTVLSAHGMLEPWLWNRQGWKTRTKKQVYWRTLAYPAFKSTSIVHAITPLEREHLRTLFPKNDIEIIPNAIDLAEYPLDNSTEPDRQKLILFLGRLEPKKGVDILLHAFARARIGSDWRVAIVGPVWSMQYQDLLKGIVAENNLNDRVTFVGPAFGNEKRNWIRKSWVMAVPSHSEVVGLVNLEGSAYCVPTITTDQTGLSDWEAGGGMLIQPQVADLQAALEQACSWSDSERTDRGLSSRRLVEERYSWTVVLPRWLDMYNSVS